MDKDTGKNKKPKNKTSVEIGGIVIETDHSEEGALPSVRAIEQELKEGGIEVVEGRKLPEEGEPIS